MNFELRTKMGWILIIPGIIFILTAYLLFAPFYLEINSETDLFRIRFHRMLSLTLRSEEHTFYFLLVIAGWRKKIDLENKNRSKYPVQKRTRKSRAHLLKANKIIALIKSFQVRNFHLRISFNDMTMNGILYPAIYLLSIKTRTDIQVNFIGENLIQVQLKNTMARMLWAYIRS